MSQRAASRPRTRLVLLSIKSECLDKIAPLGERHGASSKEYVEHYHRERHHQGIDSSIITPEDLPEGDRSIQHREWLGGILNH